MERRYHPRRQLVRNALLYHPQGFLCPCRVDNISSDGLLIRTTETRIYKGGCVDVATDASPDMGKPITAKALVVHKKDDGIGLMCESDVSLHELNYHRQSRWLIG
jgi:PilZ domain